MTRFQRWMLKRIVKQECTQGWHQPRIEALYGEIAAACQAEFTEDNRYSLFAFLIECFNNGTRPVLNVYESNKQENKMANSKFDVLELRFVIEPELTHAYVLCGRTSDGFLGVQGWHHKAFGPSTLILDILNGEIASMDYLVSNGWGPSAPPAS